MSVWRSNIRIYDVVRHCDASRLESRTRARSSKSPVSRERRFSFFSIAFANRRVLILRKRCQSRRCNRDDVVQYILRTLRESKRIIELINYSPLSRALRFSILIIRRRSCVSRSAYRCPGGTLDTSQRNDPWDDIIYAQTSHFLRDRNPQDASDTLNSAIFGIADSQPISIGFVNWRALIITQLTHRRFSFSHSYASLLKICSGNGRKETSEFVDWDCRTQTRLCALYYKR